MTNYLIRDYTYVVALLLLTFYLDFFFIPSLILGIVFLRYRKEFYLLLSVIVPRITGKLNFTNTILDIAREEGPGGAVLNDIIRYLKNRCCISKKRFDLPFMKPSFVITKPAYIRKILSLDVENFYTTGNEGPMTKLTQGGHNILLSPGPPDTLWKNQREITTPLNKDRFGEQSLVALMFRASYKICNELSQEMQEIHGKKTDLFHYLFHFMVTANNVSVFGEEFGKKRYPGITEDIYKAVLAIGVDLISPEILSSSKAIAEKIRLTKETYQKIKEMVNESNTPLLSHLKGSVKDGKIRQEEIECLMAVVVHALAPLHTVFWVCYCLALNPEVQGKLALEIDTALQSGEISYTKLSEMTYLNKVLLETLRLYPGVALLQPRYPKSDVTFGPHRIPKDSPLLIFPYLCHRNGKYYKNPDAFNCERSELNTNLNSDALRYFPFGYGPRICQGQFYAECLVKAAVISIVRRHSIRLVDGEPVIYGEEIGFCRPSQNVEFIITERKSKSFSVEIPIKKVVDKPQAIQVTQQQHTRPSLTPKRLAKSAPATQTQFFTEWIAENKLDTKKAKFQGSLLILYASQSGKSKDLALKFTKIAQLMELFVSCRCVADYNFSLLPDAKLVVVITSTYGNGEPPMNGVNLYQFLNEPKPTDYLKGTKYAVLKVGSTIYSEPFAFGNFVDLQLKKFGASRVINAGEIDEIKYNDENDFSQFVFNFFSSISVDSRVRKMARTRSIGFLDLELFQPRVKLVIESDSMIVPQKVNYRGFFLEEVTKNTKITSDIHSEIYEMEIKNSNNFSYQVGDEVCVFPQNPLEEVTQLINRLGFSQKNVFRLYSESSFGTSLNWNDIPTTLFDCLTYYFDINAASPSLLKFFATCKGNK